ncbi:hypothetical protein ES703_70179 [subsurface metagenome]
MCFVEYVPRDCLALPVDEVRRRFKQIDGIGISLLIKITLGEHNQNVRTSHLLIRCGFENFYSLGALIIRQENICKVPIQSLVLGASGDGLFVILRSLR